MATPIAVVEAFLTAFNQGSEGMYRAIREYFTPATVWENVGLATTTGIDEALALVTGFHDSMAIASIRIEILAIAVDGRKVLTERIDRLFNDAGAELAAPAVMGIFEVEADRIVAWRDYFDTAAARALAADA